MQEILNSVDGDLRRWAEAYLHRVIAGSLDVGAQPRGLPKELGWTASKTKDVSERARLKMVAFVEERASGDVCADRQALLDSFIATSRRDGEAAALDEQRFVAVLAHVGGCEECWLAWRARRRTLLGRVPPVLTLPFGAVAWGARALQAKLSDAATSLELATLSVRQRLGLGGGAGAAAAGGGAATVGTKAAAVCATAVCAAGAGGELAGVLPPIVPQRAQHEPRKHTPGHHGRPARQAVTAGSHRVLTPAPAPATPARAPVSSVADTPVAPEEHFTLGDLPPASSTSRARSSHDSPRGSSSAPGDLPSASSTSAGGSSNHSLGEGSSAPADLPSASATPPPPPPPAADAGGAHCVLGDLEC